MTKFTYKVKIAKYDDPNGSKQITVYRDGVKIGTVYGVYDPWFRNREKKWEKAARKIANNYLANEGLPSDRIGYGIVFEGEFEL